MKKIFKPEYLYYKSEFQKDMGVMIDGETIVDIAPISKLTAENPTVDIADWDSLIMIPGTVNAHNHCFQSLLRGLSCDRPFLEWRDNALYKYSPRLKREDIYNGAVFAFSEMMKCGVTTVSDFFYLHNFGVESDELIIQASKDVGIRLVLARTMYDWDGAPTGYVESVSQAVENTLNLGEKYKDDDMVSIQPAPHSLHAASLDMIKEGHKLAKQLGTNYHIHVAEEPFEVEQVMADYDGLTPVELLDKIGVVDESMIIIHGVWLKQSEIKTLGSKGAKLAYCPSSNMFLADGITNLVDMKKFGVKIGLGSDGACSNNRISVFEEMRMASLLQKAQTLDAICMDYKSVFEMGTIDGARLLGLPVGEIEIGKKADFVGIKTKVMSMQPISKSKEQILPNIVYSMQPDAIEYVVVNGKTTVDKGNLINITEDEVIRKVQATLKSIDA